MRNKLKWKTNLIRSLHTPNALKRLYTLSSANLMSIRKPPMERVYQKDEFQAFGNAGTMQSFDQINRKHAPKGFQCFVGKRFILFYKFLFSIATGFPKIYEAIKIDTNLNIQL